MRSTAAPAADAAPGRPADGRLSLTVEGLAWLAVAVLLGGLAWWKSLNPLLLLAYCMATLLVVNGVVARAQVRRVRASRGATAPVFAGEEVRLGVRVRNASPRPAGVVIQDRAAGPPGGWLLDALPPGAEVQCHERRSFPTRGRLSGDPPVVSSAFPFGFVRYERPGTAAGGVVVLPAVGLADAEGLRRWVLDRAGGEGRARRVLRRVTSDQADVRGVRPYRPGDSLRWVHWRSSARRRELMVREYDAAPAPDLVLVVEPWLPEKPSSIQKARLETAMNLAVTVAWTWSQAFRTRVTLVVGGAEPVVRTVPSAEAAAREALTPLADVAGSPTAGAIGPGGFERSLATAARLVVSSMPRSPLAPALSRSTGRPFIALDPTMRLPWYQPPAAG